MSDTLDDSFDPVLAELASALESGPTLLPYDVGPFTLERPLGKGGFGSVFAARDRRTGDDVAVKVLRRTDGAALLRFKREFRWLAEIRHPNLVDLHELLGENERWLLSMERVDGIPFDAFVRVNPQRLRETLAQLVRGVRALHDAGVLHRDLKPSNVLVAPDGKVVILDFGLVQRQVDASTGLAGTPAYMSPEQCGAAQLTEASDLYAIGVMLHEALHGALPFEGPAMEIVRAKQRTPAPRLESAADPDLASLTQRLLATDPAARPTTRDVLETLDVDPVAGPEGISCERRSTTFVGRTEELSRLGRALEDLPTSGARSWFLHGVSGVGKSALLARFTRDARQRGAIVLSGRCYQRETVPFAAVDDLIDQLWTHLRALPRSRAAALLPRGAHALAQLFPVLNDLPALADLPPVPPAAEKGERRRQGFLALKQLLAALADAQPLVVILDDLQWGDRDSAQLLAELLGPPAPPRMLWIGAFRREERAGSPLLEELGPTFKPDDELALDPLPVSDAQTLANMLLADSPGDPERGERLAVESAGHPLLIRQLVDAASSITPGTPPTLPTLLGHRVAGLNEAQRQVLEALATAVRPCSTTLLAKAVTFSGKQSVQDVVGDLEAAGLVRRAGRDGAWQCFHDRLREVVSDGMSHQAKAAVNRALATALIERDAPPDAIAEAYLAAGSTPAALPFVLRAAEEASAKLAFDRAAHWYRIALETSPRADQHRPLKRGLAAALAAAGRSAEAAALFLEIANHAPARESLELRHRAAQAYLGAGFHSEGMGVLRPLLRDLGMASPSSVVARVAMIASHATRLRFASRRRRTAPSASPSWRTELLYEALIEACYALVMSDTVDAALLNVQAAVVGRRDGSEAMFHESRALFSGVMRIGSDVARRDRTDLVAYAQSLEPGYQRTRMESLGGLLPVVEGNWKPAVPVLRKLLVQLREQSPQRHEHRDMASQAFSYALTMTGRLEELAEFEAERLREAQTRGRPFPLHSAEHALRFLALTRGDDTSPARPVPENEEQLSPSIAIANAWLRGAIALVRGDAALAARVARDLDRRKTHISMFPVWRCDVGVRTSLFRLAFWDGDARTLHKVERHARAIEKQPVHFATAQASSLLAGVAARRGQDAEAERLFDNAARRFEMAEMVLHAAACRRRRGEILGGVEGAALIDAADERMTEVGIATPERFAQMFAPRFVAR